MKKTACEGCWRQRYCTWNSKGRGWFCLTCLDDVGKAVHGL